jgi:peptidoglycan hydrolase CwlO-like protein
MSGGKRNNPIPSQRTPQPKFSADTSATIDNVERSDFGTNSIKTKGMEFTDIPPRPAHSNGNWSFVNNAASALQVISVILVAAFFIWNLSSKIDTVKDDVKEVKTKIERLDESVTKQTSAVDNVSNSVQRLEDESRRTQDLVRDRKK